MGVVELEGEVDETNAKVGFGEALDCVGGITIVGIVETPETV